MPKHSKRYNELARSVETKQVYEPAQALEMVKKTANAKFDETVDVAVRLGVDPRHGDQMVRGTTSLPHGTGKARRGAVFAKGEKAPAAEAAGAPRAGRGGPGGARPAAPPRRPSARFIPRHIEHFVP